jgi:CrcB protein
VRGGGPDTVRLFWLTGVLGGFTTYSAFALETTILVGTGAHLRAFGYVLVTVLGCLAAALAGRAIGALLAGET